MTQPIFASVQPLFYLNVNSFIPVLKPSEVLFPNNVGVPLGFPEQVQILVQRIYLSYLPQTYIWPLSIYDPALDDINTSYVIPIEQWVNTMYPDGQPWTHKMVADWPAPGSSIPLTNDGIHGLFSVLDPVNRVIYTFNAHTTLPSV